MYDLQVYMGDLHRVLSPPWAGTVLVLVAVLCGTVIGLERESRNKPAGLRTVCLICVGSTIFTLASVLIAGDGFGDRGRIAAQVVTGVGFLGAGAIIREHGTVVGLTTGATIWAVSAIGVLIGAGYAAGGAALTVVVVMMLLGQEWLEGSVGGGCVYERCRVLYRKENNKARLRVLRVLDQYRVPDEARSFEYEGPYEIMQVDYCTVHRAHRAFLFELAELPEVDKIQQTAHSERGAPAGS